MKKIIQLIFIILIIFGLSKTSEVRAARVYFNSYGIESTNAGDFLVNIIIDTENENLNAIDGKLIIPTNILQIKEIRDGNSSINFWIERPHLVNNEVIFSGITPGGFVGQDRIVFSMIVHQINSEIGELGLKDLKVIKNSENGEEIKSKITTLKLPISTKLTISDLKNKVFDDKTPPEDFTPSIVNDKELFGDKVVLVFATQDKDSGINHYEVKESSFSDFEKAESPYVLKNQKANNKIFIKAIDNASNERLVVFYPPNYKPWYRQYGIIAIIIIIVVLIKLRKRWLKFIK